MTGNGPAPGIVHLGVGAFFRAHQAVFFDRLLEQHPDLPWSVCGVGLLPGDVVVRDALRGQGWQWSVVVKHPDGALDRHVVRSLREMLLLAEDPEAVLARLADPSTHIVTMTITEGGYGVDESTGALVVTEGLAAEALPDAVPTSAHGVLVEALRRRFAAGTPPFTVVSCDNLEGNGGVARAAVVGFARLRDPALAARIEAHVAFPSSMVDRITPVTSTADRELVRDRWGVDDAAPVTCEPYLQWVLEDRFPDGRPALESVGVQLVDDVRPYELVKLRLLNAGHQVLAYPGLLLGRALVHEAATDSDLAVLLQRYLLEQATPTLAPVPGIDLAGYRASLLVRFASPAVHDTLARLAAFSTDRVPRFVVPVLAEGLRAGRDVRLAAGVVAAWLRWTEVHPSDVVDNRWDGRTPEQLLADPLLFGQVPGLPAVVLDALGEWREHPPRVALQRLLAMV